MKFTGHVDISEYGVFQNEGGAFVAASAEEVNAGLQETLEDDVGRQFSDAVDVILKEDGIHFQLLFLAASSDIAAVDTNPTAIVAYEELLWNECFARRYRDVFVLRLKRLIGIAEQLAFEDDEDGYLIGDIEPIEIPLPDPDADHEPDAMFQPLVRSVAQGRMKLKILKPQT